MSLEVIRNNKSDRRPTLHLGAGFAAVLLVSAAFSTTVLAAGDGKPLVLEKAGVTYAGGKTIQAERPRGADNAPGSIRVQQVPVHFMVPAEKKVEYPVVMVPGYGVSGAVFQATTDGREGWMQHFARAGIPAYATIQSNVAESGINIDPWNKAKAGDGPAADQPMLFHWTTESFWDLFGYGPKFPETYADTRQPIEEVDALISALTPVDTSIGADQQIASLTAVLEGAGPAILMSHSASGPNGFAVAKARPDLVKAIVAVEPIGCTTDEAEIKANFTEIPIMMVFADQIPTRGIWVDWMASCATFAELATKNGGNVTHIVLPDDLGIKGNTHMMMVENNSDEIADIVIEWIDENVK